MLQTLCPKQVSLLIISLPAVFAAEIHMQYDANGNLVTGDGKFREYNSLNQLIRVRNGTNSSGRIFEEFTYHPTQERILVKKTYNSTGNLSETVIYLDENFVRITNRSGNFSFVYVKQEGQLVAQRNPDGTKFFMHSDPYGSSTVITNASGTVKENTSYSPLGEILTGGNVSRYDYEDKEFDSLIGQYDFHFRQYDPSRNIYGQPDTLIQNVYDPQSLNRYSFERNNAYKYEDKDGHLLGILLVLFSIYVLGTISTGIALEEFNKNTENADKKTRLWESIVFSFSVVGGALSSLNSNSLGLNLLSLGFTASSGVDAINLLSTNQETVTSNLKKDANNVLYSQPPPNNLPPRNAYPTSITSSITWSYNPNTGLPPYPSIAGGSSNLPTGGGSGGSSGSLKPKPQPPKPRPQPRNPNNPFAPPPTPPCWCSPQS